MNTLKLSLVLLLVMSILSPQKAVAAQPAVTSSLGASVYSVAESSVVMIIMKDKAGKYAGKGSGFVVCVCAHKYIATAAHCLDNPKYSYTIILWDGSILPVTKKALSDPADDVALACVDEMKLGGCPALTLATQNALVGEDVLALGYPWSFENLCETRGVVSQYAYINNAYFIGFTATIWHGDSGGPLLDANCHVVGVIDAMLVVPQNQEPFYFAVPVSVLQSNLANMIHALSKPS